MKSMTAKSTKRIAILLAFMMIMSLFIGMTSFGTRADADAASESDNWVAWLNTNCRDANNNGHKATIYVENGQSFFISDWWQTNGKNVNGIYQEQYGSGVTGATYSSGNKTVATVTSNGKVTLKEKGTATITIKYKTDTIKVTLKVVGKGVYTKKLKDIISSNILDAVPSWKTNMNYAIKSACGGTTSSKSVKVNKDNYVAVTKYISKSSGVVALYQTYSSGAGIMEGMLYDGYTPTGKMIIPQAQTYIRVKKKWNSYLTTKLNNSSLTQENVINDMMPKEFNGQAGDTVTATAQMSVSLSTLRACRCYNAGTISNGKNISVVPSDFYSSEGHAERYTLYNASGSEVKNGIYTVFADLYYKVGTKDVVLKIESAVVTPGTYYLMKNDYNYSTGKWENMPVCTITLS